MGIKHFVNTIMIQWWKFLFSNGFPKNKVNECLALSSLQVSQMPGSQARPLSRNFLKVCPVNEIFLQTALKGETSCLPVNILGGRFNFIPNYFWSFRVNTNVLIKCRNVWLIEKCVEIRFIKGKWYERWLLNTT